MNVQQTTIFDFLGVVEETPKTISSPQGKERENINKAFDNLIKTLKDENFF